MDEKERLGFDAARDWYLEKLSKELLDQPENETDIIDQSLNLERGREKIIDYYSEDPDREIIARESSARRVAIFSLAEIPPQIPEATGMRLTTAGVRFEARGSKDIVPYAEPLRTYLLKSGVAGTKKRDIEAISSLFSEKLLGASYNGPTRAAVIAGAFKSQAEEFGFLRDNELVYFTEYGMIVGNNSEFRVEAYPPSMLTMVAQKRVLEELNNDNNPRFREYNVGKKARFGSLMGTISKALYDKYKETPIEELGSVDRRIRELESSHGVRIETDFVHFRGDISDSATAADAELLGALLYYGEPLFRKVPTIRKIVVGQKATQRGFSLEQYRKEMDSYIRGSVFGKDLVGGDPEMLTFNNYITQIYKEDPDLATKYLLFQAASKYFDLTSKSYFTTYSRISPQVERLRKISMLGGGSRDGKDPMLSAVKTDFIASAMRYLSDPEGSRENLGNEKTEFFIKLFKKGKALME